MTLVHRTIRHGRLRRSPLGLVVGQVRFASVLKISDRNFVAPFQDAIRKDYPSLGEEQEQGIVLSPAGMQNLPGRRQWRFSSADSMWSILLADDALTLETRAYSDADDFVGRLETCLTALAEHIRPQLIERIGLRYINECRHAQGTSAVGWRGLITPQFLGPLESAITERYQVQRILQQIQIAQPNDEQVVVRHGYVPSGTTIPPSEASPSETGPFYLLDFDHFAVRREDFDVGRVTDSLIRFHAVIWDLFRLAVTDALFDYFQPQR